MLGRSEVNILGCYKRDGVLNARANVFGAQSRIVVSNDFIKGETFVEQLENSLHRYARACYTGLPGMYPGIDHNPLDHMLPRHSMIVLLCVSCTRIDRHRSKYNIPQQGADPKAHILAAIHFHMAHFLRLL